MWGQLSSIIILSSKSPAISPLSENDSSPTCFPLVACTFGVLIKLSHIMRNTAYITISFSRTTGLCLFKFSWPSLVFLSIFSPGSYWLSSESKNSMRSSRQSLLIILLSRCLVSSILEKLNMTSHMTILYKIAFLTKCSSVMVLKDSWLESLYWLMRTNPCSIYLLKAFMIILS